jgi:hypothetical protein
MKFTSGLSIWVLLLPVLLTPGGAEGARENLLLNPDFEFPVLQGKAESPDAPAEWNPFSSMPNDVRVGQTTSEAHGGKQSCRIRTLNMASAHQGIFQSIAVTPGDDCEFIVYVRMDRLHPLTGTQRGMISVEFRDQNDEEIKRVPGPEWRDTLSSTKWTKLEMTTKAPDQAVRAHFVITLFEGLAPGGGDQSVVVDDASLTKR